MNLLVSTNWCAHADGSANNPKTSKRMYTGDYLTQIWRRHISISGKFATDFVFVYGSNCDVMPYDYWVRYNPYLETFRDVKTQHHAHDVYAGMTMAAQYALLVRS